MDRIYDFSSCETSLRRYGGSDRKSPVKMENQYYMLKYNDIISESKRNEYNSSYRNSAFSEYVACHIFESVGIPTQETLLGYKGKKVVVACKIAIGKVLKLSPPFPPLHTGRATFIAPGVPSN